MLKLYSEIFGGNMKKYLFLPILLFFISCTAVNVSKVVSDSGISTVNSEIAETIEDLKEAAKLNEYEKLKEFFLPTFKNNYIVKNIKQYDLSRLTFLFSDVKVITTLKARGTMIINYGNQSDYYIVTWERKEENGKWKISNVVEKK